MRRTKVIILALVCAGGAPLGCGGGGSSMSDAGGQDGDNNDGSGGSEVASDGGGNNPDGSPNVPKVPWPRMVAGGLNGPCGIAAGLDGLVVADASRVVTFAADGTGKAREVAPGVGGVARVAAAGQDVVVTQGSTGRVLRLRNGMVTTLASGQAGLSRVRIKGGYAYWVAQGTGGADGAIRRVSVEGGTVETIAMDLNGPGGFDVAKGRVYVAMSGLRAVAFFPIDGSPYVWLKDAEGNIPTDIVVDEMEGAVFWSAPGDLPGGLLHRGHIDLTTEGRIGDMPPHSQSMVLDADRIYFKSDQTVSYSPRGGGTYRDLAILTSACEITVLDKAVYWTEPATGRVFSVPTP